MEEWFGNSPIKTFQPFGLPHTLMIAFYLIGIIILIIYTPRLKPTTINAIQGSLLTILVTSELSYQAWGIINGTWNPREFLPFQLCSIAGIIAMLALWTKNYKLIQITFFIGIFPSFLAVITPELQQGYPQFRFWQFFIHHSILSWASLFLILAFPVRLTIKKTLETYLYLLCYATIIGFIINPIVHANFLFLARTPSANTPLSLLGNGIWYYINLCLVGILVFLFLYYSYVLLFHKKNAYKKTPTSL